MGLKTTFALILLIFVLVVGATAADVDVRAIQKAIETKGAKWTAGETWITKLPAEQRKLTMGAIRGPEDKTRLFKLPPVEDLPAQFSWRDNNGNYVTEVKNQGQCGSCSYFSTCAAVESWMRIKNGNPNLALDLSEQYVLSCGGVGSCEDGAVIQSVHEYIRWHGVPEEACFPYRESDKVACTSACPDWASQLTYISAFDHIDYEGTTVNDIKNAVYRKPVVAYLDVYTDFQSYVGGVYEYVSGEFEGGHAVLLYGWDDAEESWLCKNSWGTSWGESGFFRIKWGEVNFAAAVVMIWDEAQGAPKISLTPPVIDLTLSPNEKATRYIKIENEGTGQLEFASQVTCDQMPTTYFRQSNLNSLDGLSWWCGTDRLKGYDNHWLQYLDTPSLDLTSSANPVLIFKAFWALEALDCYETGYDGWDGCNVWVSTDGGKKFQVIAPVAPAYQCASLYSFGNEWEMGYGIAGWSGISDGWQQVSFDLSPYRSAKAVIRFAFASDPGKCTRDDSSLLGFFVDDISIKDGDATIFYDTASLNSSMTTSGFGNEEVKWLEIPVSAGKLEAGEHFMLPVEFSASSLAAGIYQASIEMINNVSGAEKAALTVILDVQRPNHDIGVNDRIWPLYEMPALMDFVPTTILKNWGKFDESDAKLECQIVDPNGTVAYSELQIIPALNAGQMTEVSFSPFAPSDTGDFRLDFRLKESSGGENASNDEFLSWIHVGNSIDDFEQASPLWDYGQAWGIMDKFSGGHDSERAIQVNSGEQYLNNMDNSLTLLHGFDLSEVTFASLRFWQRYTMEKGLDYLLIQASSDSTIWTTLDSITGTNLRWHEKEVSLLPMIGPGNKDVRVRFRFISNESKVGIGALIDDLEIAWSRQTYADDHAGSATLPQEFELQPNYPNPFNPVTQISYQVPEPARIKIEVTNLQGQVVAELVDRQHEPGFFSVPWNAQGMASGIYFYRMSGQARSGKMFALSGKMLLVK
jgi:C1A family cysteine protease